MGAARHESLEALDVLAECAVATAGFRHDALDRDALRRLLQNRLDEGATPQEVADACRRFDAGLLAGLHRAVSVGETFFFRHPEQFAALTGGGVPALGHSGRGLRAWSAGCATGEETWSLVAALAAIAPPEVPPSVLGTDLLESSVAAARAGVYRRWSLRQSAPLLHPLLDRHEDGTLGVRASLREFATFHRHNLLDAPPASGAFDVVFCRNVLVYFTPEARQRALTNLVEAVAPGGLLAFGPMDLPEPPADLVPVGSAELQLYKRAAAAQRTPWKSRARTIANASKTTAATTTTAGAAPTTATSATLATTTTSSAPLPTAVETQAPHPTTDPAIADPVRAHLQALERLDGGDRRGAEALLRQLSKAMPDYIPGVVETALLRARSGDAAGACELMSHVLRLATGRSKNEVLPGPENLPLRFYVASAEALLEQHDGID